jgi:hypothetical protein
VIPRKRFRDGLWARLALSAIALMFCAAPVPGDVGGCGQAPSALDRQQFFESKRALDCVRCSECDVLSKRCEQACSAEPPAEELPPGCDPLEHDGDVCLRALLDASCEEYRTFLRDTGAETPTECNFCPRGTP